MFDLFDINVKFPLQLCVAVVDLSLQMSSWKNPIFTFLNKYNEIPHKVLLEILKVFPEEMDTELIRLGSNRRNEIFNELCGCSNLLNDYLVSTNTSIRGITNEIHIEFSCRKKLSIEIHLQLYY